MAKHPFLCILVLVSCEKAHPPEVTSPAATRSIAPQAASARAPEAQGSTKGFTFTFDGDAAGAAPTGFVYGRTGSGSVGRWLVQTDPAAKSGAHVLTQLDADATNFRFPVAVTARARPADVSVSVHCKMLTGRVDQACGLVLRYADADNYFITRANALEDNVRLYWVKDGKRDEIASHDVEVTPNAWHAYRFEARGDLLRVFWDGKLVIEHRDATFMSPGKVGLWTKADSVTQFDDFRVEPL